MVPELCLSLAIELSLKDPDLFRCFQAHRQSPNPLSLQKRTRSQGPSLLRSYPDSQVLFPCPTPAAAAAQCRRSRSPPSPRRVSPVTRITFRTCRAHYPGGPSGCIYRFFPARVAFPVERAGRRPRFPFRGLLRLHSRYGPPGCSTALQRPLSRGFDPVGYPAVPLVSYQTDRHPIWVDSASTGYPRLRGAPFKLNGGCIVAVYCPVLLHDLMFCSLRSS
jgi:hypothetical protein